MDKKDRDVLFSHKSDSWSTPQWLFDKLNSRCNFTLDPASDDTNAKCQKHYTLNEDGLSQDWKGETVFVNPPYSKTYDWVKKAHTEAKDNGVTTVMLLPARVDSRWFHEFCLDPILVKSLTFIKGRLKFGSSKNSAPFPSIIVEFGSPNKTPTQPEIISMKNK